MSKIFKFKYCRHFKILSIFEDDSLKLKYLSNTTLRAIAIEIYCRLFFVIFSKEEVIVY